MRPELTISTAAYDGYPFDECFASLSKLRVKQVELAFIGGYTEAFSEDYFNDKNAHDINQLLDRNKLKCSAFSSHVDLSEEGIVEIFKKRMDFAKMVGAEIIISNASPTDRQDAFHANMDKLAAHAEELQIKIGLENPGDGEDNILNTGKQATAVITKIDSPWVGVNYDFGNLLSHCFQKEKPEADYIACETVTNHYHIKDVVIRDGFYHFTPIGKGAIDYRTILKHIFEKQPAVPYSLEIPLRLSRGSNAKPIRANERVSIKEIENVLSQSIEFIHSVENDKIS